MRDFAKVSPRLWIGETGRAMRHLGAETQVVAFYILTAPNSNMLGLYYLPLPTVAHETGMTIEGASKALRCLIEAGFCGYDEDAEMVWVPEMARWQIGERLEAKDKRCKGVQKEYDALPSNRFLGEFFDRYAEAYHLTKRREGKPHRRGFEGASEAHRSKEKEKEKEKENVDTYRRAPSASVLAVRDEMPAAVVVPSSGRDLSLDEVKQLGYQRGWRALYGELEKELASLCPAPSGAVEGAMTETMGANRPGWAYFVPTLKSALRPKPRARGPTRRPVSKQDAAFEEALAFTEDYNARVAKG